MTDSPDNIVPITPDARTAAEKFSAEHDRELLTILFTDLVDSTMLQSDAGNVEAARLTELHRKFVREELARYDAREIEWAGDSCLAVFSKPSDAVVFALRMQAEHRRLREAEPKLPLVRVGMHLGEIVVKKRKDGGKKTEDLFGLQVSEAARVMSVARGDQIFCTRAVFDNARGALKGRPIEGVGDAVWVNYGAFLLKGSKDPIELCEIGSADIAVLKAPETNDKVAPVLPGGVDAMRALIPYEEPTSRSAGVPRAFVAVGALITLAAGLLLGRYLLDGGTARRLGDSLAPIQSLAVLPLDNYSNDPEQEYFVDGMTDALTAELAKVGSLKVIARTSVMRYKGTDKSIREIAEELNVDALIEGSVYRSGDDIRVTAQLVRGDNEEHVWGETYEERMENILKLQGQVALAIVEEVSAALTPEEEERLSLADSTNPAAYDAYLRGLHATEGRTAEGLKTAISYFEQSVEADHEFAAGYAGISNTLSLMASYGYSAVESVQAAALSNAQRAVELAPNLAESHIALGFALHTFDLTRWAEAERAYRRAIELNPSSAIAHAWYAVLLNYLGRMNEAEPIARTGRALDPNNAITSLILADTLIFARRYDEAKHIIDQTLKEYPEHPTAWMYLSYLYDCWGFNDERIADLTRGMERATDLPTMFNISLASGLADVGRLDDARDKIEVVLQDEVAAARFGFDVARSLFKLGEDARAMEWLGKPVGVWVNAGRLHGAATWDFMRHDDRFWNRVESFGLPPLPPGHPVYEQEQAWLRKKAAEEVLAAQPKPVRRFTLPLGAGETLWQVPLRSYSVAVSPDGSHVAYVAVRDGVRRLMLRPIDEMHPVALPGTEGASNPAFSPDGQALCFYADGYLKWTTIHGGVPENLHVASRSMGACWVGDRSIIFSSNVRAPLLRIDLDSRETEPVLELRTEEGVHVMPQVLPGGEGMLFVSATAPTMAASTVEVFVFETNERRVILREATRPHYLASGHVVAAQEGRFTAIPFDLDSLSATGGPAQVTSELTSSTPLDFGISDDGMLVFAGSGGAGDFDRDLVWVDETGQVERVNAPSLPYFRVRISPDGTRAAIDMRDFNDIYVLDLVRGGTPRVLTFGNESGFFVTWTPDSRDVIFPNRFQPEFSLARKNADGIGSTLGFARGLELVFPNAVTRDGTTLLATSKGSERSGLDIFAISLSEPFEVTPLVEDAGAQEEAVLSPDGKWLAYVSNESGTGAIIVRPYPSLEGKWQVSTGSAFGPRWDRSSKRLFYRTGNSMMEVEIETDPVFAAGEPRELFNKPYHSNFANSTYDRSPVDDRFLMITADPGTDATRELLVVQNWTEEIKRLAPHPDAN